MVFNGSSDRLIAGSLVSLFSNYTLNLKTLNRFIDFNNVYDIIINTGVCKQSERKYLISTEPDLGNASVGI